MANQTEKKLPGWAVVLLVIFYPAGLIYLLCKALNKGKDMFTRKANTMTVIAAVLIFCGILYPIMAATGNLEAEDPEQILGAVVMMVIVCFACGAVLLVLGFQNRKLGKLYQKYVPGIENSAEEEISRIAAMAGANYDTTVAELQVLVDKGALKDRYIDHQARKLVWSAKPKEKQIQKIKRFCSNCGAVCEVTPGQPAKCEYCDSPIQVN